MAYTAEKPNLVPPSDVLRKTVQGWGADLDPANRPAVPKENFNPGASGAHWHFPERQVAHYERERSPEHKFLTPVFGTACPPKGLSGVIRRYAYTLSEGQSSHWLLLMLADRIDVIESSITAALRGHPDNPIAEMGLKAEITRHGVRSRVGQHRNDLKHLPVDAVMFAAKGALAAAAVFAIGRALTGPARQLRPRYT